MITEPITGYYIRWGVPDDKRTVPPGEYAVLQSCGEYLEIAVWNGSGPSVKHRYLIREEKVQDGQSVQMSLRAGSLFDVRRYSDADPMDGWSRLFV